MKAPARIGIVGYPFLPTTVIAETLGDYPVNTFARQDHMAAIFPMFSGLSVPAHIASAYRSAYKYWKPININSEDWRKIHKRLWMIWWSHRPVDITTGNWSRSDTVIQSRVSISHVGGDGIDRWSGGWRRFVNGRAFVNTPPVVSPLEMRSTSSSASCARLCRWHIKHLRIRIIKREPCLKSWISVEARSINSQYFQGKVGLCYKVIIVGKFEIIPVSLG